MKYRIDERVGCIAVVEETYKDDCLSPDFPGVIAFWNGLHDETGWRVLQHQKAKALELCMLLNKQVDYAAIVTAAREYMQASDYPADIDRDCVFCWHTGEAVVDHEELCQYRIKYEALANLLPAATETPTTGTEAGG